MRSTATAGSRSSRRSCRLPNRTSLEQGSRDELRVVPGRRVAATGKGEETGTGRTARRLRRADEAVELPPGDRHRDVLRVAAGFEEVGPHRTVGAAVAA